MKTSTGLPSKRIHLQLRHEGISYLMNLTSSANHWVDRFFLGEEEVEVSCSRWFVLTEESSVRLLPEDDDKEHE